MNHEGLWWKLRGLTNYARYKRVFSVAAPTTWNQLPVTIKSSETIATFQINTQELFFFLICISTKYFQWSLASMTTRLVY